MTRRVIGLCMVCLCSLVAVVMAEAQNPNDHPLPLRNVEERARNAKRDIRETRAFVDEIFNDSLLRNASLSVRGRLSKAETDFRTHKHPPIEEKEFVTAVNRLVDENQFPAYLRTSVAQVRRFRKLMTNMTPNAISPTSRAEMTPAEAVLVAIHLGYQKVFNPDFAVPPDEWARTADQGNSQQASYNKYLRPKSERPRLLNRVASPDAVRLLNVLGDSDESEFSDLTFGLHIFLDSIGVRR